jgi:signal transduction histidine kinase
MGPMIEEKGLALHMELDPNTGPVSGDRIRLMQVISNLLSNAIKFTPSGGGIEVRLKREDRDAQIKVVDTGEGIERELLPFIFDRFRQGDSSMTRRHGGLGLGLTLVRCLVEAHHGKVWVDSAGSGQGTTVTVQLPLAAAQSTRESGNQ